MRLVSTWTLLETKRSLAKATTSSCCRCLLFVHFVSWLFGGSFLVNGGIQLEMSVGMYRFLIVGTYRSKHTHRYADMKYIVFIRISRFFYLFITVLTLLWRLDLHYITFIFQIQCLYFQEGFDSAHAGLKCALVCVQIWYAFIIYFCRVSYFFSCTFSIHFVRYRSSCSIHFVRYCTSFHDAFILIHRVVVFLHTWLILVILTGAFGSGFLSAGVVSCPPHSILH